MMSSWEYAVIKNVFKAEKKSIFSVGSVTTILFEKIAKLKLDYYLENNLN